VAIPGVTDVVSGFAIFRLVTLRNAFRQGSAPLLISQGWAANAELYDRAARYARRVETINAVERQDLRQRPSRITSWDAAMSVWRARGPLRQVHHMHPGESSALPREAEHAEVAP
jgi:hypothetical protein